MSVVAWDGTTLAADRRMTEGNLVVVIAKLWRGPRGSALAGTGDVPRILDLRNWWLGGAKAAQFPALAEADGSNLIVVTRKDVVTYSNSPVPVPVLSAFMAWGAGADLAMGAMAMGADAERAVEVANSLCPSCGNGVDAVRVRRGRA